MGIYLVDLGPDSWAQDELTSGIGSLLDHALAKRGLGTYPGPLREVPPEESFEEKILPALDGFVDLCARHDAEDVLNAALFVPVPFDGLITLPVGNGYDKQTRVLSSYRLRDAVEPMATEIGLPVDLPRGGLALTTSIEDPVTFYVAVFRQAAEHSLRHGCPIGYV
ncbi:hypothetical protein [Micromonospora sp. CA-111912]|uniref:hypothetical protein n=1 Tax=Micromonospora sp. CA-111912 TaxID=3239955 RepID=UPI003D91AF9C